MTNEKYHWWLLGIENLPLEMVLCFFGLVGGFFFFFFAVGGICFVDTTLYKEIITSEMLPSNTIPCKCCIVLQALFSGDFTAIHIIVTVVTLASQRLGEGKK